MNAQIDILHQLNALEDSTDVLKRKAFGDDVVQEVWGDETEKTRMSNRASIAQLTTEATIIDQGIADMDLLGCDEVYNPSILKECPRLLQYNAISDALDQARKS
jgi:hypothetical protein